MSQGSYSIGFAPVDISNCAATATVGNGPASGPESSFPAAYAVIKNLRGSLVVGVLDRDGNAIDAPFNLVVVC